MIHCALILMASLPSVWLVVVIGLIVITVASLFVCVIKWHEAAVFKKEVLELRDTIRMMRYEEANLSRMLHTVERSEDADAPSVEGAAVIVPMPETQASEEPLTGRTVEDVDTVAGSDIAETVQENPIVERQSAADIIAADRSEEETPVVDSPVDDIPIVPSIAVEEEPVVTKPRKQAINERRPAIPNDLFAAWFEENASIEPKESETEVVARQEEVNERGMEVSQEVQIEIPAVDAFGAELPVDVPVTGATVSAGDAQQIVEEDAEGKAPIELSKEDERFCRKLERIVNARMRNPDLNIDVIASQFGIGRTNFYRKVRELMNISPNDYLRKCRMERAAELLRSTELNIAEICTQVGIPDAQYFSRVFKAHFGMPPSVYREQK